MDLNFLFCFLFYHLHFVLQSHAFIELVMYNYEFFFSFHIPLLAFKLYFIKQRKLVQYMYTTHTQGNLHDCYNIIKISNKNIVHYIKVMQLQKKQKYIIHHFKHNYLNNITNWTGWPLLTNPVLLRIKNFTRCEALECIYGILREPIMGKYFDTSSMQFTWKTPVIFCSLYKGRLNEFLGLTRNSQKGDFAHS